MAELTKVRGVITSNITLSGVGQVSDGLTVGSTGVTEAWLVAGQTNAYDNGSYSVDTGGVWTRRNTQDSFLYGDWIRVQQGTSYANSRWLYTGVDNPTGTTPVTFQLEGFGRPTFAGLGLQENRPYIQMPTQAANPSRPWHGSGTYYTISNQGVVTFADAGYGTQTHIGGLYMSWVSPDVKFTFGAAYIVGPDVVYEGPNTSNPFPSFTGTANTQYYFYGYPSGATLALESSTAAPVTDPVSVAPGVYFKGPSDTTRRYLGSLRTNASGVPYNFTVTPFSERALLVSYLENTAAAPFRVESAIDTITNRTVGLGSVAGTSGTAHKLVPPTARMAILKVVVNATASAFLDNSDMSTSPASQTGFWNVANVARQGIVWMPLDSSQSLRFANSVAGGATSIDVLGYVDQR